eukprot:CAMPEP_0175453294 /NCGR_PEP_ID=MMETSP0095-20121207/63869_1 /TAXON_ID=311494 /ORGANISM="Alexandrium monilatum, Strain CCMP3105" /LENGTH=204 /DNA_ID=CAMNT_0016753909 /DNA_START=128 /DNA_END=739 /DNA_ORIENTATION=+
MSTTTSTSTRTTTTRTTLPGETLTSTTTSITTKTTTTSSTHTTVTTTTSVTTTTGMECAPPGPLLPITDCQRNISAGAACRARTLQTHCVDQSELEFYCPLNGTVQSEPELLAGTYEVHCMICGFSPTVMLDTDRRPGVVSSELQFGPSHLNGTVNESGIVGYAVFMVDSCGRTVGSRLAYVSSRGLFQQCCQYDEYAVQFTAQ